MKKNYVFLLLSVMLILCSCSEISPIEYEDNQMEEINSCIGGKYWKSKDINFIDSDGTRYTVTEAMLSSRALIGYHPDYFIMKSDSFRYFYTIRGFQYVEREILSITDDRTMKLSGGDDEFGFKEISNDRVVITYWHNRALFDLEKDEPQQGSYVEAVFEPASDDEVALCIEAKPFQVN